MTWRKQVQHDAQKVQQRARLVYTALLGRPIAHRTRMIGGTLHFDGSRGYVLDHKWEVQYGLRISNENKDFRIENCYFDTGAVHMDLGKEPT